MAEQPEQQTREPLRIVVFSRRAGFADGLGTNLPSQQHAAYEELASTPESGARTGFVVDLESLPEPLELIRALRQHPEWRMQLIWTRGDAGPESRALTDGAFETVDNPGERIETCSGRLLTANGGQPARSQDDVLLTLLWSHPHMSLQPVRDWSAPELYRYPLLDVLLEEDTPEFWLRGLKQRRLVEGQELVDRVRLCPGCRHGHLSFVDVCPECDSLDIRTEPGLHCFSCGHVAPQRLFQDNGMLSCPNCHATLRHIGEDYDRPLENHVCGGCQHMFMEGRVLARCMACGQAHDPDALEALGVYRYRLSEAGRLVARTGDIGDLYGVFDEINYVSPEHFEFFFDWTLKLRERHEEIRFGLILLHLNGLARVIDTLGHGRGAALVDSFAERVKALVRTTDLVTRTADDRIWLLLPQTSADGVDVLAGRLSRLMEDSVEGTALDRLGRVYHESSIGMSEAEDAAAVMARLVSRSQ
ncbi:diguanylate cyclase domain-containing protein [Thioalkalivibrio sp. ALMg11]|uniref:TackOD1 domain-containing metal-binding protein n=1 Tax=Thioalkalivibrio sp. ALMg11 TaxID=1158165 RepID=UPI0003678919|nr:diguanylate cyclase [Thioalkalivibrio sp. ALMg11]